jgi:hypothetical protein
MLQNSAILVRLQIYQIGLSIKDNNVTDAAHKAYNINDKRAGYYRKFKIDRTDVKQISQVANMARSFHRMMTVPWGHESYRLLPSTLIVKYQRKIKQMKMEFYSHVSDLEARWPSIISAAQLRLGPAFNQNDYVDSTQLKSAYVFDIHLKPIPKDDHFVLEVEKETLQEMKDKLNQDQENNMEDAMSNLWHRLYEVVERMAERLDDNNPRIFKTLVTNIEKLTDILPDLNLAKDPQLTKMCIDVKDKLCVYTPGQLKKDRHVRNKTAKEAKEIQNKMDALMGKA